MLRNLIKSGISVVVAMALTATMVIGSAMAAGSSIDDAAGSRAPAIESSPFVPYDPLPAHGPGPLCGTSDFNLDGCWNFFLYEYQAGQCDWVHQWYEECSGTQYGVVCDIC